MLLCALGSMLLTLCTTFSTAQIASRFSRSAARRNVPQGGRLLKRGNQPFLHCQPDYPHDQRHFAIADVLFSFGMQSLIKAPIMAFIAVGKISTKSWEWSLLTGGVIAFVCVLLVFIMLYAVPRMKKNAGADGQPEPHHA